jgi:small conductance mechanosensitive channel
MEEFINKLIEQAAVYTPRIIGAIATLIIGLIIIGQLTNLLGRMMSNRKVDPSLAPFLKSLFNAILKVLLVVSTFSILGIAMTSFVAIIGAAGLAIGMALSGTLQNFAGGVMLLILKPFKVGDFIEAQGYSGSVKEIQIFHTIMKTPDNKTIVIPNGGLSTRSLINYSTEPYRRVDLTVGIGYGDSTARAREVLMELIESDERILRAPEVPADPFIAVSALADSSVNFAVRLWVKASDYWGVTFDMNEKVYNRFNEEGLNIPFPQMDVHLHQA